VEIKVITDLSAEPVLLAVAKNYVAATYGTDAAEDAKLTSMIKVARQLMEKYCNLSLGSKVIEIFYHADEVILKRIKLPYGPHSAMTATYPKRVNQVGTATSLTLNTDYYKRGNQFWELEFLSSSVNPWSEGALTSDDYLIRLTAGYGAENCEALPEAFIQAIKLQVLRWYRHEYDGVLWPEVKRIIAAYSKNLWL